MTAARKPLVEAWHRANRERSVKRSTKFAKFQPMSSSYLGLLAWENAQTWQLAVTQLSLLGWADGLEPP